MQAVKAAFVSRDMFKARADRGVAQVSDSYLGVIQVFDRDGTFLDILGDEKGSITRFETPTGMFIDKQMRLYVVEMLANRVRVLQLKD